MRAYDHPVSKVHLREILDDVSGLMPPLDQRDMFKLSVHLPSLAKALLVVEEPHERGATKILKTLLPESVSFVFIPEYHPIIRSYTTQIIFATLYRFLPHEGTACPVQKLIVDGVLPAMASAVKEKRSVGPSMPSDKAELAFCDALGILGILGSAAANRRGISTANSIVTFLLHIACFKSTTDPHTFVSCSCRARQLPVPF